MNLRIPVSGGNSARYCQADSPRYIEREFQFYARGSLFRTLRYDHRRLYINEIRAFRRLRSARHHVTYI